LTSKSLQIKIKIRLHESLLLSTQQYAANTWPITVDTLKKLEAEHHRWMRKLLDISWNGKVTDKEVR